MASVGNVLQGVPFYFDNELRPFYTGSFWALFNPFAILCGLTSVAMIIMQGGCYLSVKTEDPLQRRAVRGTRVAAFILIILFILGGVWIAYGIKGYVITSAINHAGLSNPLHKTVATQTGFWLANFVEYPWFWIVPILGFAGAFTALIFVRLAPKLALIMSSFSIFGIISTVGVSMFPFILPSSSNPQSSLVIWDASASQLSLQIMFISVLIFMPIILIYTAFVYRVLRGKVTTKYVNKNKDAY